MAVPKKKHYSHPRLIGVNLQLTATKQSCLVFYKNKTRACVRNLSTTNSIYYKTIVKAKQLYNV